MWHKKWIKLILASILIIAIIVLVLAVSLSKPNEETIINILIDNGITINGSDSNIIVPNTGCAPHHVAILLRKEELKEIKIIDSGYDFIKGKYFCIFEIQAFSVNEHLLRAKALMLLHFDNGWKLSDDIGVLFAHYELSEGT